MTTQLPSIDDLSALKEVGATKFGWLSPDGGLVACELHRHLEVLFDLGVVRQEEIAELREDVEIYRETAADCQAREDRDEHPNWHCSHGARAAVQSTRFEILDRLYEAGWIRLGINGNNLHSEGLAKSIRRQARTLADLAALLNLDSRPEPVAEQWRRPLAPLEASFAGFLGTE